MTISRAVRLCGRLLLILLLPILFQMSARAQQTDRDTTTIRITDKVLVKDVVRLGINLGGDNYWDAPYRKKRVQENFEGTLYSQCHFGPGCGTDGFSTWWLKPGDSDWTDVLRDARYTVLSGPSKWTTGKLTDITTRQFKHRGQDKPFAYFLLDKTIEQPPRNGGLLLDTFRIREGYCDIHLEAKHEYWATKHNRLVIGDVHKGSFGCAALALPGSERPAHVRFATHYQSRGELNGTWHVSFWTRTKAGNPTLKLRPDRYGKPTALALTDQWQQHDETFVVNGIDDAKAHLTFVFQATGGDVLIDDVEIWMEGDANPTAFRDDLVATLRKFNPGPLRYLQMGGSTVENTISPGLRTYAFVSQRHRKAGPYNRKNRHPYSLHELYTLCEHIGSEPWYCLPGTLTRDEITQFMEYLGAPPDVGFGRKRAEMGHPKPWTETFKAIHVEFGNEAWNPGLAYAAGGFNGPDYWHDLIETGKQSPYYKPNVLFHASGQAASAGLNKRIMASTPNADRFAVAPYLIQGFSTEEYKKYLNTNEKFYRWAFAWPIFRSRDPERGAMYKNDQYAREAGTELSIYEVNHHTTHDDAPLEPRNRLVTSIGGAVNVINNMLLMMKEHNLRTQCFFNLCQNSFAAPKIGRVRLWGSVLTMRKGHERYRPTFLACSAVNKVIAGDLVETVHSPGEPTFTAEGIFQKPWRKPGKAETYGPLPVLWSYAFADGNRRGLVVINLDVTQAHTTSVVFDGQVVGAKATSWLLTAQTITANNEFETDPPQVTLTQNAIDGFTSGSNLTVRPFSIIVLDWTLR